MNVSKISKFIPIASVVFIFFAFSSDAFAYSDMTMIYAGVDGEGYPVYSGTMQGSCVGQEGVDYAWIFGSSGHFKDAIDGNPLIACSGLNEYNPASDFSGVVYLSGGANTLDPPANCIDEFGVNYVDYCEHNNGGYEPCTTGSTFRVYFSGMIPTIPNTTLKSGVLFGRSSESQIAIQSGGSMLAAVGLVSTSAFCGLFPFLILSIGVFVRFYIIQELVMFLGREKLKKKK